MGKAAAALTPQQKMPFMLTLTVNLKEERLAPDTKYTCAIHVYISYYVNKSVAFPLA